MGNKIKPEYYLNIDQVRNDLRTWNKRLIEITNLLNELNKDFQRLWEAIPPDAKN